jgi:hypothetical protein
MRHAERVRLTGRIDRVWRGARWRIPAGLVAFAAIALMPATHSGPGTARLAPPGSGPRRGGTSAAAVPPAFRAVLQSAGALAQGPCPPNPTYPSSPTDQTQYGVPFTAAILNGTVNVGYNEDTGLPGTTPLTNPPLPYAPWTLHLTGLNGTVSGCVPLPGLQLAIQPSDLHVNTYGYLSGPTTLAPHARATYTFTGIANPWQFGLPLYLAGSTAIGGAPNAAAMATVYYQTAPSAGAGLQVGPPTIDKVYTPTSVQTVNLPAGSPPGATLQQPNSYAGQVTVTNTTTSTVTNVAGTERAGFVSGPTTLGPGASGVYTFTIYTGGDVPNAQYLGLTFSGSGPSGLVSGFGIVYDRFPSTITSQLVITGSTINGVPAMTAPGPTVPIGSVINGTVTLQNPTSSSLSIITGTTNQTAQLLVGVAPSGVLAPPFPLVGFTLSVSVPAPLVSSVAGVRPDAFGSSPFGAIDATSAANATGTFTSTNPVLACGEPVSTTLTTGSSTVVPVSPPGQPPHANGPQWTVQGQPIEGPIVGATAQLVSNTLPLQVPATPPPGFTQPCTPFNEVFNWEIGGIKPDGHFYNGDVGPSPTGQADAGAPAGEVQLGASVILTSVGGLPTCHPSTSSAVSCG